MKNQGKGAQKKWERKVLWLLFCPIGHKKSRFRRNGFRLNSVGRSIFSDTSPLSPA
jgi:hypothetical protein